MTELYVYDLSKANFDVEEVLNLLPTSVLERVKRRADKADLRNSCFAWSMIAQHYRWGDEVSLEIGKRGKPSVKNCHFNLSHSKNLVAILYSDQECGVDLQVVEKGKDYDLFASKIFSEEEKRRYLESDEKEIVFTRIWSEKEAWLKKTGQGVDVHKLHLVKSDAESVLITAEDGELYMLSASVPDGKKLLENVEVIKV